jgi:PAS domain S-box-containing protein
LFGGLHSWLFWVGLVTVGCIVPAIILFHRRRGRSIPWVVFASCLVVFGVLCERYVIVIPGQTNPPHLFPGMEIASSQLDEGYVDYTISIYETLQSFGVIGVIGLMFLLGLKFMALAPTEARMTERPYAREYLEGIVENSADIIITVSPRGRIETFNRGAEQSLGYHRDEVIGRRIELIFAREQDRRIALRQLADSDNVRNFATDLRTKSGEIRNVLLTLTRLRNAEGKQIGTFGISKDITEERRLLRQLIKAKKMAAIGEALTGIQHAVKNMLNALKGGAFLVNKGIEKRNRERMVEGWAMVEEGIERMSGLSSSLLTFARDWKLELKKVDVVELVDSIAGVVTETGRERGVEIETALADNLPLLRCDQKLIHIVLMDLVTNAMDACAWKDYAEGEQPRIELRARLDREGEHFYITVADNGCGMSEEVARSIFKPFFTTKEGRGTGLGLALADRIIEVHGGRIQVESDLGRGTTFRIVLPVAPSQRAEETNYVKESAYH